MCGAKKWGIKDTFDHSRGISDFYFFFLGSISIMAGFQFMSLQITCEEQINGNGGDPSRFSLKKII